jgi:hypothetical protein
VALLASIAIAAVFAAGTTVLLQQERGVLFVQATIDGSGPLLFVFDPGGDDVYTSDAKRRLNGRVPRIVCLSTACLPANMQFVEGDPNQIAPKHDVSHGIIDGNLGRDLLQHYVVTIDYRASTLTLVPAAGFKAPAGALRLPLKMDAYGLPLVQASVDGIAGSFEVDVRAPTSMLFRPFIERSGLDGAYAQTPIVKQSTAMTAHAIRTVRLGTFDVHDEAFWFSTETSGKFANPGVAGLLGNNVLAHFVLTLDLVHASAYLL